LMRQAHPRRIRRSVAAAMTTRRMAPSLRGRTEASALEDVVVDVRYPLSLLGMWPTYCSVSFLR
jgi:uncharacterized protein (UPF0147 family)